MAVWVMGLLLNGERFVGRVGEAARYDVSREPAAGSMRESTQLAQLGSDATFAGTRDL
jgi:hypothetical protein